MPTLRNNFDGGTDGVTITTGNSGADGQNAFNNVISSGTGIVNKFTSVALAGLNRPTAEFVMETSTTTNTGTPVVQWTTSMGSQTEIWLRYYVYFSAFSASSSNLGILAIQNSGVAGSGLVIAIQTVSSPRTFAVQNINTGAIDFSVIGIVANAWQRIEFHMIMGTSLGSYDLYYYGDADSNTYTDYVFNNHQNYGASTANTYSLGEASFQPNTPSTYYSAWELNTTGYPGPAPFRQGLGSPSGNLTNPIAIHSDVN